MKALYWSHFQNYVRCPQRFLWYRGWKNIDLGNGPGKPKPKPKKSSEHHALMGDVIQYAVECFYNKKMYKEPSTALKNMKEAALQFFEEKSKKRYIEWDSCPPKEELLEVCINGIDGFIDTLKAHTLIGPYARSEVQYIGRVDRNTPIGGRVDIVIQRPDTGITLLDGKNSKYKGKYLDHRQLVWYALCYYAVHRKVPDRLGYIYWRFPHGLKNEDGSLESGIEWIDFSRSQMKVLAYDAIKVKRQMDLNKFDPTPSNVNCKFCDYESVCTARQKNLVDLENDNSSINKALSGKGLVELPMNSFPEDD